MFKKQIRLKEHFGSPFLRTAKNIFDIWIVNAVLTGIFVLPLVWFISGDGYYVADRTLYCDRINGNLPNCHIERVDWLNQKTKTSIFGVEEAVIIGRYPNRSRRSRSLYYQSVELKSNQKLVDSESYAGRKDSIIAKNPSRLAIKSFTRDETPEATEFVNKINYFIHNESAQKLTITLQKNKPSPILVIFLGVVYVIPLFILFCWFGFAIALSLIAALLLFCRDRLATLLRFIVKLIINKT